MVVEVAGAEAEGVGAEEKGVEGVAAEEAEVAEVVPAVVAAVSRGWVLWPPQYREHAQAHLRGSMVITP